VLDVVHSEKAFGSLVGSLPGMVYRSGREPWFPMDVVAGQCTSITGYPSEVLAGPGGPSYRDLIVGEDRDAARATITEALHQKDPFCVCYRIVTAAGTVRSVWEQGDGLYDQSGELTAIESHIVDITCVRRLEEQLQRAARMEALGLLAGGMAHDFNNLLSVILASIGTALPDLPEHDAKHCMLTEALDATRRAAQLSRRLLNVSRDEPASPTPLDLNSMLRDELAMLRRLVGDKVDVVLDLDPDLEPVYLDPRKLEQALLNLAGNAKDAMPNGGRLRLCTRSQVHADQDDSGPEHVLLVVEDSGTGMSEAVRARVFEPFFSTKPADRGTGLGLFMVQQIVAEAGGQIGVTSTPGKGTRFELMLPAHRFRSGVQRAARPSGQTETILLVDDDELVRAAARRILSRQGYGLLEAASGEQALELARSFAGKIDLLVTDLSMPGMSGLALAEALAEERPEVRVLFMSGSLAAPRANAQVLPTVPKPFSVQSLALEVRASLDAAGSFANTLRTARSSA
jgi:signal transduction histidine kinase